VELAAVIKSRYLWWGASTLTAATLAVAPAVGKWSQKEAIAALVAATPVAAASYWLSKKLDSNTSQIVVRNHLGEVWNVDRLVEDINMSRAQFDAAVADLMQPQTPMYLPGIGIQQNLMLPPAQESALIPTEDLAKTLANERSSGTLIMAPSGCGKTRLLQQAIVYSNVHYKGDVDFCILDNKGDESGWLGLENDRDTMIYDDESKTPEAYRWLQGLKQRLKAEKPSLPTIAVIDEWNNGLGTADEHDEITEGQKYAKLMKIAAKGIVTKGRSKRVYGWMTTHSPKTDAIGMDSATRQSLNIIILARGNKLGLIASVLKGTYTFVDDDLIRQSLSQTFQEFMQNPDPESPIALTNLSGQWRLVRLPPYPDEHPPLDRKAFNQSTQEILDDSALEAIDKGSMSLFRRVIILREMSRLGANHPIEVSTTMR